MTTRDYPPHRPSAASSASRASTHESPSGPVSFFQVSSSVLLGGYVLTGGETISFELTSGSAFIYGATTDNVTNDPSVQFATRID